MPKVTEKRRLIQRKFFIEEPRLLRMFEVAISDYETILNFHYDVQNQQIILTTKCKHDKKRGDRKK